jgi:hypothetical protein
MHNHHRCTTRSQTIMYRELKKPIEEESEYESDSVCESGSDCDSDCDSDCSTFSGYGMSPYNHMCVYSPNAINNALTAISIYVFLLFWISMVEIVKKSGQC